MNHLINIIHALDDLKNTDGEAVLATVVRVEGSAYRQPSARMLIQEDGQAVGMVSGSCLEKHLVKRAFWLTRDGACVQRYHSATDGDNIEADNEQEGFGLGCNGTIEVLFERVNSPHFLPLNTALQQLKQDKQPQVLQTVIASHHPDFPIGSHVTQTQPLPNNAICIQRVPASRKSAATVDTYQAGKLSWQVFHETLQPPLHLVIFGAGQDSVPLIDMAQLQGWVTTLIDSRADSIHLAKKSLNSADTILHLSLEQAKQIQPILTAYPQTAVAIMTHSVTQDKIWLQQVLTITPQPFYIGQLGPSYRTEQLLADMAMPTIPSNLYYPMGLPIGGDTPEAVALATVAQIQQRFSQSLIK